MELISPQGCPEEMVQVCHLESRCLPGPCLSGDLSIRFSLLSFGALLLVMLSRVGFCYMQPRAGGVSHLSDTRALRGG